MQQQTTYSYMHLLRRALHFYHLFFTYFIFIATIYSFYSAQLHSFLYYLLYYILYSLCIGEKLSHFKLCWFILNIYYIFNYF